MNYDDLDPGIRETVRWLRGLGYETTDSGDGETKSEEHRSVDGPHVFMRVDHRSVASDADLLFLSLRHAGIHATEGMVQATYDPGSAVQVLALFGVDDAMLAAARGKDGAK